MQRGARAARRRCAAPRRRRRRAARSPGRTRPRALRRGTAPARRRRPPPSAAALPWRPGRRERRPGRPGWGARAGRRIADDHLGTDSAAVPASPNPVLLSGRNVDQPCAVAGGEEPDAGSRSPLAVIVTRAGLAGSPRATRLAPAGLRAHQQRRIVAADRARADQDRVAARAHLVDPVEVRVVGQNQPGMPVASSMQPSTDIADRQQHVRALLSRGPPAAALDPTVPAVRSGAMLWGSGEGRGGGWRVVTSAGSDAAHRVSLERDATGRVCAVTAGRRRGDGLGPGRRAAARRPGRGRARGGRPLRPDRPAAGRRPRRRRAGGRQPGPASGRARRPGRRPGQPPPGRPGTGDHEALRHRAVRRGHAGVRAADPGRRAGTGPCTRPRRGRGRGRRRDREAVADLGVPPRRSGRARHRPRRHGGRDRAPRGPGGAHGGGAGRAPTRSGR